jgi:predicted ATPase
VAKIIITRVSTNSGFLEHSPVEFSPGVTCIIGARGTCKTTLIESIRFAFDFGAQRVGELVAADGIIRASLKAGTVTCEIERTSQDEVSHFVVEREVDSLPRVFRDGVREYAQSTEPLHEIEIYSSGELQKIADDTGQNLRLNLVDRPNRGEILSFQNRREQVVMRLRGYGPELRALRADLAQKRFEVKNLSDLQSQLWQTRSQRPQLSSELEAGHAAYQRHRTVLAEIMRVIEIQGSAMASLESTAQLATRLSQIRGGLEKHAEAASAIALVESLAGQIGSAQKLADEIRAIDVKSVQSALQAEFDVANSRYNVLRQEQQTINESLKREDSLRRQIEHLESIQEQVLSLEEKEVNLLRLRAEARNEISLLTDKIYQLRVREVDAINSEHAETVVLALHPGEQTDLYVWRLSELLAGSRIRGQEDIANQLALRFRPSDLIDLLEGGDAKTLAEILERDLGQMTRIVAYLREHPDLYDLEGEVFEDKLEITMYDRGQPKPVELLSKGQRATALLPLILRPSPCPLIFDQPEDDLDNSFIFKSLIKVIRQLKNARQLIFVTHNANIPVLGDADRVIVMNMTNPLAAGIPQVGSVDERKQDILDLLEGGREAFEERQKRYGSLLG